jgi:exopolysaccharide biosynthesis polyprenyl glycosylphosphotransferase
MVRNRTRATRVALLFVDGAAASFLFLVVSVVRLGADWRSDWQAAGAVWWLWAAGYGLLWVVAEWSQQLDQLRSRWTFRGEVTDILRAALILAVSVFSILFLVQAPDVSRLLLIALFACQVAFSVAQRRLLRALLVVARNRNIGTRAVLVLGTGTQATRLAQRLQQHPALGYRIIGHLGTPSPSCPSVLGPVYAIEDVIHSMPVDEIVAALDADDLAYLDPVIGLCHDEGKRLRVVLQPGLASLQGGRLESLAGIEILTVSNGPDRLLGFAVKRSLDVVLSAVALIVLAPVLLLVAIAVRVDSGAPILFRQERVGRHGRRFAMYKFRTMAPDAESRLADLLAHNVISGPAFKLDTDPRITRVGKVLRRTSLDELPQLWNVVRGQMSLVGPRPPLPTEVAGYDLWHRRRLSMKPGITGLWQVSARLEAEFDRWVELDLRYIDRWSLWLDVKIMARTIPAMLTGR